MTEFRYPKGTALGQQERLEAAIRELREASRRGLIDLLAALRSRSQN